jgi:hypothetical protein
VPAGSGFFDQVNGHEPKSAPAAGLSAALWLDTVQPNPTRSGQATVSLICTFSLRLYTSMLSEPQDAIDPRMMTACVGLMAVFCGNFGLDGTVAAVDLLGMAGPGLTSQSGYLVIGAGQLQRVMTITIPVLIDDAFAEVE